MPDRLKTMAMLVRVIDEGSITAGARALRMPIATVSRRISELEADLNAELVLRSPRGLTLTDAGTAYVAACRRILEEVAEAERSASGEFSAPRGTLTLTAPIVFGRLHVLPVVTAFLHCHPEVNIQLQLTDRNVSLGEEHIDMAIRIGPLPDSGLIARKVGEVRHVVCASPSYLDKHGRPNAPDDLEGASCITLDQFLTAQVWGFEAEGKSLQIPVHARLTVNTAEAALDAAEAGLGFTRVLSYQAAPGTQAGRLATVLQAWEPKPLPIHLVYERRALIPQKLRAFIDFAAPRIAHSTASVA
ncbi:LysR family transcriptional regulator [Alkalilimnicola ehrlichii]|uniref:LysR family transcriptional regulator n=1 Tax=Alkalilimnicola ehrlichii TaxID=351052 RepID=A0A3E0X2S3_9GAMM|nr:LysR family transcriptional regulator [Alkalilimnicola ehrlichii]RFA30989.1 LysR family transcriptional regulator [Alkalilimnicola ehrlichii]RFA38941.1 LysR family transcriptional regulator [Alkalilimnicola ehrlichii]